MREVYRSTYQKEISKIKDKQGIIQKVQDAKKKLQDLGIDLDSSSLHDIIPVIAGFEAYEQLISRGGDFDGIFELFFTNKEDSEILEKILDEMTKLDVCLKRLCSSNQVFEKTQGKITSFNALDQSAQKVTLSSFLELEKERVRKSSALNTSGKIRATLAKARSSGATNIEMIKALFNRSSKSVFSKYTTKEQRENIAKDYFCSKLRAIIMARFKQRQQETQFKTKTKDQTKVSPENAIIEKIEEWAQETGCQTQYKDATNPKYFDKIMQAAKNCNGNKGVTLKQGDIVKAEGAVEKTKSIVTARNALQENITYIISRLKEKTDEESEKTLKELEKIAKSFKFLGTTSPKSLNRTDSETAKKLIKIVLENLIDNERAEALANIIEIFDVATIALSQKPTESTPDAPDNPDNSFWEIVVYTEQAEQRTIDGAAAKLSVSKEAGRPRVPPEVPPKPSSNSSSSSNE